MITSVGSPAPVIDALRSTGCQVWSDVATLRHAERAIELGVDGLVLLGAGAGGQTGAANPFAFARAVRRRFDGTVILAGGISDGIALRAAQVLGCDLAYMGTRFIATRESMAPPAYKRMLVDSELDDVMLTSAFTGLPTNMLRPSIAAAGLDPDALGPAATFDMRQTLIGAGGETPARWRDVWSAGHSVSGVDEILPVAELVAVIAGEYETAAARDTGALRP